MNGRRDKKHARGSAHGNDELSSITVTAVSSSAVVTGELLPKIENWENEVLPKIEKWNNDMAMNIPAPSENLPPRSQSRHSFFCVTKFQVMFLLLSTSPHYTLKVYALC